MYDAAMAKALDYIVRRLQLDINDGSRPDQWTMEDLIRTAKAALPRNGKDENMSNGGHRCIAPLCEPLGCHECNCAIPADIYAALWSGFADVDKDVARYRWLKSRTKDEQMINMSHCRFQNTLEALRECRDALIDGDSGDPVAALSEDEQKAAHKLFKLCEEFVDADFA